MPYFKKIPAVQEMNQWFPGKAVEGVFREEVPGRNFHYVTTAHQQRVYLEPGDWVVKEPSGDGYYPIKDSIQRTTYYEVDAMGDKIVEVKE